jgi:hypothetical protein
MNKEYLENIIKSTDNNSVIEIIYSDCYSNSFLCERESGLVTL